MVCSLSSSFFWIDAGCTLFPHDTDLFGLSSFCWVWTTFGQETHSHLQDTQCQTRDNLHWSCSRTLFIDAIVMPFSFLVACFVNDEAMVGDHKLSLRHVFSSCMNSTFPSSFFQEVAFAVLCNR
jgi:hypothetical protein